MRRLACALALSVICLGLPAAESQAGNGWHGRGWHGHGGGHWKGPRVVVGVGVAPGWGWGGYGPGWGWGPGVGWGGWGYGPGWYAPAYGYPAYGYPPVVIQQRAPEYIERSGPTPSDGYWYYCESEGGYYPRVPTCPEPWMKVAPEPQ